METNDYIVKSDDCILITGAAGFIGARVVEGLLARGFRNLRCLARPTSPAAKLEALQKKHGPGAIEIVRGNLLSREDCEAITKDVVLILHLAAGRGEKSFPDAFINSVVTTRNLLEGTLVHRSLQRFVNISSFTVYTNREKRNSPLLDESCPVEPRPEIRGEAYCFAKVKQDELVTEYGQQFGIPYVIVRPGYVYGPGNRAITGRVGIGSFGRFLHLGGSNTIPFSYVDNCADAIVLAGLRQGVDGHVFNIVDDDLPSSRRFLRLYKQNVGNFKSIYVPHFLSYALCWLWQRYSAWSKDQLPPVFGTSRWHANWKRTKYSNAKIKTMLGWSQKISTENGLRLYFEDCRAGQHHA